MKLTDNLPRPVAWVTRIIVYGIAAAIALVILNGYGQWRLAQNALGCMEKGPVRPETSNALTEAKELIECLERRNGMLENFLMRPVSKAVRRLPVAPCKYVGIWLSSRPQSVYRITLQDDGEYIAEPTKAAPDAHVFTGFWSVHEGSMVWFTQGIWPPDINAIKDESERGFTLIERDGSRTEFTFLESLETNACSR